MPQAKSITAEEIIRLLDLKAHPEEGGFYSETYRSTGKIVTIGNNLTAGERPQVLVPKGVWQGARLKAGGSFALFGCTVAPGFEFADYEHGNRETLIRQFPKFKEPITALTR